MCEVFLNMDYRYYREIDPRLEKFLIKYKKYFFYLKYLGIMLFIGRVISVFLIVIKVFPSTLISLFLVYLGMLIGGPLLIIGAVFDNLIDKY